MLLYGNPLYYRVGRRAVASVLDRTDFDIFLAVEPGNRWRIPRNPTSRVHIQTVSPKAPVSHRSIPFLLKFQALQACLNTTRANQIVLLDADTVVVADISGRDVYEALNGHEFGMVEQRTIRGSSMNRKDFLDHYRRHSLAWFDPSATPPILDDFRYGNSGVVLGKRVAFEAMVNWAIRMIGCQTGRHQVGNHMIADQDYFQYWTNTLHPGCCQTLPGKWNHCRYWDEYFPDPDAVVIHLSNFCQGPDHFYLLRMHGYIQLLRLKRLFGRLLPRLAP